MAKSKKATSWKKEVAKYDSTPQKFEPVSSPTVHKSVVVVHKTSKVFTAFKIFLILAFIAVLGYAGFYGWQYKESFDLMKDAGTLMRNGEYAKAQAYCSLMSLNSIKCYSDLSDWIIRDTGKISADFCSAMKLSSLAYWERGLANRMHYTGKIEQCVAKSK